MLPGFVLFGFSMFAGWGVAILRVCGWFCWLQCVGLVWTVSSGWAGLFYLVCLLVDLLLAVSLFDFDGAWLGLVL